ncbi:hypothetical protein TWF281_008845 [Arthrobotrys megalospora]
MYFSKYTLLLPVLLGLGYVPAARGSSPYQVFDTLDHIPDDWEEIPDTQNTLPSTVIELEFSLDQPGIPQLEQLTLDMSTPGNPSYGQHLTPEEMDAILEVPQSSVAAVQSWLESHGFNSTVRNDHVAINITIEDTESLLQTTYKLYRHATGRTAAVALSYSLPLDLHSIVEVVEPTNGFPALKRRRNLNVAKPEPSRIMKRIDPTCDDEMTPSCLAVLYKYEDWTTDFPVAPENKIAVYCDHNIPQTADINKYLAEWAPDKVGATYECISIHGSSCNESTADPDETFESNFDMQHTLSATWPYKNIYYSDRTLGYSRFLRRIIMEKSFARTIEWGGSGFSKFLPRHSWQATAVNNYLDNKSPDTQDNQGWFVRSGRAYPDVAARANRACNYDQGKRDCFFAGTSASTPIFASIITLINGDRISKGKKPLGFLNPFLYSIAGPQGGLTDITGGRVEGCVQVGDKRWRATEGWDAATGWGSPKFHALKKLANDNLP